MGVALTVRGLRLSYRLPGGDPLPVLDLPVLTVMPGEAVGITGASGSGKTSLLHVLCGLEIPDDGAVIWDGVDIAGLSEAARDRWRRGTVGIVFQDFHLLAGMSALGNVLLPAYFGALRPRPVLERRARWLLGRVGVLQLQRDVAHLSRGEMQRVAIARALLFAPPLIVADEPTASLDAEQGWTVADLLLDVASETGSTLVVASHDTALLERLDTIHRLPFVPAARSRRLVLARP